MWVEAATSGSGPGANRPVPSISTAAAYGAGASRARRYSACAADRPELPAGRLRPRGTGRALLGAWPSRGCCTARRPRGAARRDRRVVTASTTASGALPAPRSGLIAAWLAHCRHDAQPGEPRSRPRPLAESRDARPPVGLGSHCRRHRRRRALPRAGRSRRGAGREFPAGPGRQGQEADVEPGPAVAGETHGRLREDGPARDRRHPDLLGGHVPGRLRRQVPGDPGEPDLRRAPGRQAPDVPGPAPHATRTRRTTRSTASRRTSSRTTTSSSSPTSSTTSATSRSRSCSRTSGVTRSRTAPATRTSRPSTRSSRPTASPAAGRATSPTATVAR